jgi:hypothetical protein
MSLRMTCISGFYYCEREQQKHVYFWALPCGRAGFYPWFILILIPHHPILNWWCMGASIKVGSYLGFGLGLSLPLLYLHKKRRGPAAFAQI